MSAEIVHFPTRRPSAIFIVPDSDGILVLAGAHGWLHADLDTALRDAAWLAENFNLPIRVAA
jgi:hypothetical protein